MLKNYLISAIRNIIKNKQVTIFNILGLSFSMSVCLLIIVIIQDQYSYDNMHSDGKNIYRIQTIDHNSKYSFNKYASTTYPLADELTGNYPFVEKIAVLNNTFGGEARYEDGIIDLSGFYTDSRFFDVFDFKLIRGKKEEVLEQPYSIVMREDIAKKYFGDEDPVGKSISIDGYGDLRVTGLVKKPDSKTHLNFESLVSSSTIRSRADSAGAKTILDNWDRFYSSYIYMIPVKGTDPKTIQSTFDKISTERYRYNEDVNISFYLYPFKKIVPGPVIGNELGLAMPKVYLIFFTSLALVIILLASFNYTSLSIARSLTRLKEFGLRKTVGSDRKQIIFQILIEAIIISFVSLVVAIGLLQFILPAFKGMKLMSLLEVSPDQNIKVFLWFLVFALVTGIIAGILPAVYVARVNPIVVLRGAANIRILKRVTFRKILLAIQYVFTIIFIITIILVYRQMIYMTNAEMGFDRELVYNIRLNGADYNLVSDIYKSLPEVIETAGSSHVPGVGSLRDTEIRIQREDEPVNAHYFSITPSYIETMGLEIIAGKDMPEVLETKNELFAIISEQAVNTLGFDSPINAVGKNIFVEDSLILEIRGVVRDYKYCALFLPLRPLVLRVQDNDYNIASLRISTVDLHGTIEKFKEKWKEIDPDHEMEGMLLDDEIRDYYSYFEDIIFTVGFVTFISILISSLGLLGMASYSIQTRNKEIGIRKVFGAKSNNIIFIIGWSSIKMLVIAAIIATPITYIVNNLWLIQIPLHVSYGAGNIIAGILVVLIIGILSILSQTIKACNSNPAEILKYE